ncbi:MAG: hypothetical protein GX058_06805 [Firmicutes bacterium]|nr:hypothetical protein [Bacillota bacterium]
MRRLGWVLTVITLIVCCRAPASAGTPRTPAQIVVLVGGVSAADLLELELPFLKGEALRTGAIALLNTRTAGAYSPENCYASLATGARAQAPSDVRLFLALDEVYSGDPADSLYRRYYWQDPSAPRDPQLTPAFLVNLGSLQRSQAQLKYTVQTGLIASVLRARESYPLIIGAGDSLTEPGRPAALLAMGPDGLVPAADFAGVLIKDPTYPGGLHTNYRALLQRIESALARYPVIFVEAGDFLRLYDESDRMTAGAAQRWKRRMLAELDLFLAELTELTAKNAQIWLVSAYPAKLAYQSGNPVTFIMTWGANIPQGLLTSNTTRRPGLITNQDFAPGLLQQLGLAAPQAHGSPLEVTAAPEEALAHLVALNQRWVRVNQARSPLLKTYVVSQIIVVALGAVLLLRVQPGAGRSRSAAVITALCLAESAVPLILLATGSLLPSPLYYALVICVPLIIGAGAVVGHRVKETFALVYLGTTAAIILDILCGWGLGANSVLGYDPIGGARFYGIGNEFMGVLIGSFCSGWSLIGRPNSLTWNEILPLLTGLGCLFVLGFPGWGANVGGTIGFAVALAAWLLQKPGRKIRVRSLLLSGLGILVVLTLFAWWDLRFNPTVSHLGRFAANVATTGLTGAWEVFSRKLAMNWRLLHYTIWADGLIAFVALLALTFRRPRGLAKKIAETNPRLIRGFWAALFGALAAFIANDSGVVAAATLLIYPSFLLLAVALALTE